MGKLGGNWSTKLMIVKRDHMWEVCVYSFGKPAPIGPRLAKRKPLPDYPVYAGSEEQANELMNHWYKWLKETEPAKRKRGRK